MDPRPTDTGDTMTTSQMASLLRADMARVDAAGAAHSEQERIRGYNEQRNDLGGPRGEGRAAGARVAGRAGPRRGGRDAGLRAVLRRPASARVGRRYFAAPRVGARGHE